MFKFKTKYDTYREKKGTIQTGESVADASQQQDADIYANIEKYGIQALIRKSMAEEPLYLDNTNRNMGLAEAVRQREQMEEYFAQMPAKARKVFGDNPDVFIEKYKQGEFNQFLQTGVFTKEQVEIFEEDIAKEKAIYEKGLEINNNSITGNNTNSSEIDNTNIQNANGSV